MPPCAPRRPRVPDARGTLCRWRGATAVPSQAGVRCYPPPRAEKGSRREAARSRFSLVHPGFERRLGHLVAPRFRSPAARAHERFGVAGVDQAHAAAVPGGIVGDDELVVERLAEANARLDLNLVVADGSLPVTEMENAQRRRPGQHGFGARRELELAQAEELVAVGLAVDAPLVLEAVVAHVPIDDRQEQV